MHHRHVVEGLLGVAGWWVVRAGGGVQLLDRNRLFSGCHLRTAHHGHGHDAVHRHHQTLDLQHLFGHAFHSGLKTDDLLIHLVVRAEVHLDLGGGPQGGLEGHHLRDHFEVEAAGVPVTDLLALVGRCDLDVESHHRFHLSGHLLRQEGAQIEREIDHVVALVDVVDEDQFLGVEADDGRGITLVDAQTIVADPRHLFRVLWGIVLPHDLESVAVRLLDDLEVGRGDPGYQEECHQGNDDLASVHVYLRIGTSPAGSNRGAWYPGSRARSTPLWLRVAAELAAKDGESGGHLAQA